VLVVEPPLLRSKQRSKAFLTRWARAARSCFQSRHDAKALVMCRGMKRATTPADRWGRHECGYKNHANRPIVERAGSRVPSGPMTEEAYQSVIRRTHRDFESGDRDL